ncbi:Component of a membrane-bound complex containing the Tor2p kinase [Tieghemiomyces parasiticus]|uniref:Component of a membrane-bound complex containing the Tor2p kinase n=1 Tax=Tieghemiomyces parasiticus TaxID=78921 RepID=A0A9W8AAE5_9FUNG|nr:Component of a membrane-bound complex containing the Tor2p kinase [Tieghemiomyces parasiticus]
MSLITDPDFLVYQLQLQFLKSEDRIGDRLITFPSTHQLLENPYIRREGPAPELQYIISPDIQFQGDFYFADRTAHSGPGVGSAVSMPTTPGTRPPAHHQSTTTARHRAATDGQIPARSGQHRAPPPVPLNQATSRPSRKSTGAVPPSPSNSNANGPHPPPPPAGWSRARSAAGSSANASASTSVASSTLRSGRRPTNASSTQPYKPEVTAPPVPPLPLTHPPQQPPPASPSLAPQGSPRAGASRPAEAVPTDSLTGTDAFAADLTARTPDIMDLLTDDLDDPPYPPTTPSRATRNPNRLSVESDDGIDLEADLGSGHHAQPTTLVGARQDLTSPVKVESADPTDDSRGPAARHSILLSPSRPVPLQLSPEAEAEPDEPEFERRPLSLVDLPDDPGSPPASGLTRLLTDDNKSKDNPFAARYRALSGQGDVNPLPLEIFLPHATESKRSLRITMKRNATVEDVIGFTLFEYIEQAVEPELATDQLVTVRWNVRMVEDDGSIDEDFPVLDRTRQIAKFGADQFALCSVGGPAGPSGVVRSVPVRTPSRGAAAALRGSPLRAAGTIGPRVGLHLPVAPGGNRLIKVHIHSTLESLRTTTMSMDASLTLSQILQRICSKWQLDSTQHILTTADTREPLDLQVTLHEMPRVTELHLYRNTVATFRPFSALFEQAALQPAPLMPDSYFGVGGGGADDILPLTPPLTAAATAGTGSANLGGTPSGGPHQQALMPPPLLSGGAGHLAPSTYLQATSAALGTHTAMHSHHQQVYCQFIVVRRTPMFTAQERQLIIDGDYIHIGPSEQRQMFDSVKTSVHHISAIKSCNLNRKAPRKFKLMVIRDHGNKSYDLEAATAEEAQQICSTIHAILRQFKSDL